MGHQTPQAARVWRLASRQHGVVSRRQLLELGFSAQAIKHRVATGRLHQVARGVYAVGRPDLGREGRWMVAVLACGADALLSHTSAAALWEIGEERRRDQAHTAAAGLGSSWGTEPRGRPAGQADWRARRRSGTTASDRRPSVSAPSISPKSRSAMS
jgi:Transcriptional regulator, AbiEi antitoxin